MAQKLVYWNTHDVMDGTAQAPGVLEFDPAVLARTHPELARAIGRGRISSHSTQFWGPGMLITLVVDY